MSEPELLFTMRLNKARHDKDFQRFLAPMFGLIVGFSVNSTDQLFVLYEWRMVRYLLPHRPVSL